MSEITSIGQKLAEQASQNAQYEAGNANPQDLARFQEALKPGDSQPAQGIQEAKFPGPADIQSPSSSYSTQATNVINSSTQNINAIDTSKLSLPPEGNSIAKEALSKIDSTNKQISAIGADPSLSVSEAASKTQEASNGLVKYLKQAVSDYQNMSKDLEARCMDPNLASSNPGELIRLQHQVSSVGLMSNVFSQAANSITNGIKTLLQQQ